jgi:hypothetical protein
VGQEAGEKTAKKWKTRAELSDIGESEAGQQQELAMGCV